MNESDVSLSKSSYNFNSAEVCKFNQKYNQTHSIINYFYHRIAKEIKEDAVWLKNNVTPEADIYVKWKTTSVMRRNSIKDQTIQDILLDWPLYTSSFGHLLVSYYKHIYYFEFKFH